jgi:hypothetical protein
MHEITMLMNEQFGQHHNRQIQAYLAEQYVRVSSYKGVEFSLRDISESFVANSIKRACAEVGMGVEALLRESMVRAFIDVRGNISPVFEIRENFYQRLLKNAAKTEATLVFAGDTIEYQGKCNHVNLKRKRGKRVGESVAGFINGTTAEGEDFSLLIDSTQWEQMRTDYFDQKLNGSTFVDLDWQQSAEKCFLYHRLIDEFVGATLENTYPESYLSYRQAVDFQQKLYNVSTCVGEEVYSSRGYKIGKSVKLFDSADVMAAKASEKEIIQSKVKLKVVVDNQNKPVLQQPNPASSHLITDNDESFDQWGTF